MSNETSIKKTWTEDAELMIIEFFSEHKTIYKKCETQKIHMDILCEALGKKYSGKNTD